MCWSSGRRWGPHDAPAATEVFGRRALFGAVPRAVWAVVALHTLLLVLYTVLVPLYRAPDEYKHVDYILHLSRGEPLPELTDLDLGEDIVGTVRWLDFRDADPRPLPASEATIRAQRPAFEEAEPLGQGARIPNQMTQHPPLYYLVLGWLVRLTPTVDSWSFDRVVGYLRLLNVPLAVPLPLLAFAATRRLVGGNGAVPIAAAVAGLAVPQFFHIGGSVNNDNLFNLATAVLAVALVFVSLGDLSRRTAGWVAAMLGIALLSKGFALALPPWIVAAYALGWLRGRSRPPVVPLLLALGASALAGGWWWVRNLVRYGELQPSANPWRTREGFVPDPSHYWPDLFAPFLLERWWGSFGWVDNPLPWPVVVAAWVVLGTGIVAGLVLVSTRHPGRQLHLVVMVLPTMLTLAVIAYGGWRSYARTGVPLGVQGRYLYAGLVGLLSAGAIGYGRLLRDAAGWLPLLVLAGAGAMHLSALLTILGPYWGPDTSVSLEAVRALVVWSPWPGRALAAMALLLAGSGTVAVVLLAREALPSREPVGTSDHHPAPVRS
ncbi:MAG: hypothetical protein GEU81_10805 [Nitriliruptorales bacterium]|nr:hypothetical protein [Nitriliruptorales bacterium]